jgi:hypothetical protein
MSFNERSAAQSVAPEASSIRLLIASSLPLRTIKTAICGRKFLSNIKPSWNVILKYTSKLGGVLTRDQ